MLDLKEKNIDIKNSEIKKKISADVDLLLLNWEIGEANDYLENLLKLIGLDKETQTLYEEIVIKLSYFTLAYREDEEVEELLKTKLVKALKSGVDVSWCIDRRMYFFSDNALGWKERRKMINFLNANTEILGLNKIDIKGKQFEPAVANWLRDYNLNITIREPRAGYEEISYFNKSLNVRKLNKETKDILLEVLKVYDNIIYPAFRESVEVPTTGGVMESFIKNQKFEGIKTEVTKSATPTTPIKPKLKEKKLSTQEVGIPTASVGKRIKKIKQLYLDSLTKLQKKYQVNEGLIKYKNEGLDKLMVILETNLNKPNKALPALALIVNKDKEFKVLTNSQILQKLATGQPKEVSIKEILRAVLLNCGLLEAETAIFMIYLAKANKKLFGLAYEDLKEMTFKWR